MDLRQATPPTVRELLIELRGVQDALRRTRHPRGAGPVQVDDLQLMDLVHRGRIAHELRRRARAYRRRRHPSRAA